MVLSRICFLHIRDRATGIGIPTLLCRSVGNSVSSRRIAVVPIFGTAWMSDTFVKSQAVTLTSMLPFGLARGLSPRLLPPAKSRRGISGNFGRFSGLTAADANLVYPNSESRQPGWLRSTLMERFP